MAQSSGEAEYYALVRACSEDLGMQSVMRDLGREAKIVVHINSSAAQSVASRTGLGKLRHMEVKFLWAQEAVRLNVSGWRRVNGLFRRRGRVVEKKGEAAKVRAKWSDEKDAEEGLGVELERLLNEETWKEASSR